MTKGFYNLTSGILSQTRRLNVIANNMTNLSTAGYKTETYTDRTFQEVLISRVGNKDKSGATVIGEESYILAPDQLYVNYAQGSMKQTGMPLDFSIQGDGFFAIQTDQGVEYTRGGSFSLDDQGRLCLSGHGLVLGMDGQPITLTTDSIRADGNGRIYTQAGAYLGQIGVFTFADNGQLAKAESGLFTPGGQQAQANPGAQVLWQYVEESNVDMLKEMTQMLTAQRSLQGGAQLLKLYDSLLTKATTEVGRL
jgi:flagellar basal-body rod protein FlgF